MKIEDLKVLELKDELLKRGRSVSGNRNTLLIRLLDELKKRGEDLETISLIKKSEKLDEIDNTDLDMDAKKMSDLFKAIENIKKDTEMMPKVLTEIKEIGQNLADMKNKMGELEEMIISNKEENISQKNEIVCLKSENLVLRNEIRLNKIHLNKLDQYSRKNNIEIQGIPIVDNELEADLLQIINKLALKMKINLQNGDIEKIHRLRSRSTSKSNIIVAFKDRNFRDEWMAKDKPRLLVKDALDVEDKSSIFINNNLTPYNKELFWLCRNFVKENSYKFCWFSNGKLLIRKDEKEEAILITSSDDLKKLKVNVATENGV